MERIRNYLVFLPWNPPRLPITDGCDPQACYDSFKEHWHQALKILQRTQQLPNHDDVLGVVNHLEHMITLLQYDLKKEDRMCLPIPMSPCLEHLLNENILDKLFDWGMKSGKYINTLRCEQLKIYDVLIKQLRHLLLVHEPFLKPLLKLLASCQGDVFSSEIEILLVDLLRELSAVLTQHPDFIKLFFQQSTKTPKFLIFSLLIPFVHREDTIGFRARDALLLCMPLSKKNINVATYIAEQSDFSVLVASGLSELYRVLPKKLVDIVVPDWHRFTPDDINEIRGLPTFVTSLEFSFAVAQVAHPMIRRQLQDFFYMGFLMPVLGPALLSSNVQEQIAATAYLELLLRTLRTITEPGLLRSLLLFLLKADFDGKRLLDILIQQINQDGHLCLVTLALFESMIDLNCEDLMLELVFKHLQSCFHLMQSQRGMLLPIDPYCKSFEKLLSLAPNCCQLPEGDLGLDGNFIQWSHFKYKQSLYGKYYAYLCDARNKIGLCQVACMSWNNSYSGDDDTLHKTISNEENSDSLFSSNHNNGYESFNLLDNGKGDEFWKISSLKQKNTNISPDIIEDSSELNASANVGLFLSVLMGKLEKFLSNSIYINLHLTGLISKLASYPQPVLRAYLLDHSFVLQPTVPSIFEIIGVLKQRIEQYMSQQSDGSSLIRYAQDRLIDREIMLVNLRSHHKEKSVPEVESPSPPLQRNGPKRSSISSISNIFSRRPSQIQSSIPLVASEEGPINLIYPKFNEAEHVALCAVLLDEWVKELAALAQEHTIAQLATLLK